MREDISRGLAYDIEKRYSEDDDGGNALFAAVEFWDSGLIYNNKRNKVAALKYTF